MSANPSSSVLVPMLTARALRRYLGALLASGSSDAAAARAAGGLLVTGGPGNGGAGGDRLEPRAPDAARAKEEAELLKHTHERLVDARGLLKPEDGPEVPSADGARWVPTTVLAVEVPALLEALLEIFRETPEDIVAQVSFDDDGSRLNMLQVLKDTFLDTERIGVLRERETVAQVCSEHVVACDTHFGGWVHTATV